jgi:hypothetical protein
MTRSSTQYYRDNRISRRIIYNCPHCNYETANCRISLRHHIHAKHTSESEKPYQCPECERGFAQKAHLNSHREKVHGKKVQRRKVIAIAYMIKVSEKEGKSKNTKARQNYYKNHSVIKTNDLNEKKHEYLPKTYMKQHDIHYDQKNGFIYLQKCPLWGEPKSSVNHTRKMRPNEDTSTKLLL